MIEEQPSPGGKSAKAPLTACTYPSIQEVCRAICSVSNGEVPNETEQTTIGHLPLPREVHEKAPRKGRIYPSMRDETRLTVDTETAAHWLSLRPFTLYQWSSRGIGPLTPTRVGGRLCWSVDAIKALVGGAK